MLSVNVRLRYRVGVDMSWHDACTVPNRVLDKGKAEASY
jgi:hypothetical protein